MISSNTPVMSFVSVNVLGLLKYKAETPRLL